MSFVTDIFAVEPSDETIDSANWLAHPKTVVLTESLHRFHRNCDIIKSVPF